MRVWFGIAECPDYRDGSGKMTAIAETTANLILCADDPPKPTGVTLTIDGVAV
jgi:hypothetical protein